MHKASAGNKGRNVDKSVSLRTKQRNNQQMRHLFLILERFVSSRGRRCFSLWICLIAVHFLSTYARICSGFPVRARGGCPLPRPARGRGGHCGWCGGWGERAAGQGCAVRGRATMSHMHMSFLLPPSSSSLHIDGRVFTSPLGRLFPIKNNPSHPLCHAPSTPQNVVSSPLPLPHPPYVLTWIYTYYCSIQSNVDAPSPLPYPQGLSAIATPPRALPSPSPSSPRCSM